MKTKNYMIRTIRHTSLPISKFINRIQGNTSPGFWQLIRFRFTKQTVGKHELMNQARSITRSHAM